MPVLFISHSSKHDGHASALEAWLRGNGFTDFFVDHQSIAGGEKWREAAASRFWRMPGCLPACRPWPLERPGAPGNSPSRTVRVRFLARSDNHVYERQRAADGPKIAPNYDYLFMDELKRDDPDNILEGWSALYHVDRVSLKVSASDILADSFPELQSHRRFQNLEARGYDLRALPVFRFDSVVEEPAKRYGVEVDSDLVYALMDDAPKEDALPLLAFGLQRLWRQYAASGKLTKDNYNKVGGLRGLIEDSAERALRGLEPEQDVPLTSLPATKRRVELGASTFVAGSRSNQRSGGNHPARRGVDGLRRRSARITGTVRPLASRGRGSLHWLHRTPLARILPSVIGSIVSKRVIKLSFRQPNRTDDG
jgi:hypothetical protein